MKHVFALALAVTATGSAAQPSPAVEHFSAPALSGRPAPFSTAVRVGDVLYLSGQIGIGPDGKLPAGFEAQAKQTMENVGGALKARGLGWGDVFKCTVMIDDMADWPKFNTVYVPMKVDEDRRLTAVIEQEIEKPVLADAHRALASGEPLTFGPLTLELDGVRHLDDFLSWSDLDFVRVDDQAFVFIEKSTQLSFVVLPAETVPFPRVLVSLLARRTELEIEDRFWTRFV